MATFSINNIDKISFKSVLPDSEDVRITNDVPPLVWAVDLIMVVTEQSRHVSSSILHALEEEGFDTSKIIARFIRPDDSPIMKHMTTRALLVTLHDALDLVMALPGDTAKANRDGVYAVLKGYVSRYPLPRAPLKGASEYANADGSDAKINLRCAQLLRICDVRTLDAMLIDGRWYVNASHLRDLVNAKDAVGPNAMISAAISDHKDQKRMDALFRLPPVGVVYAIESANFPGMLKIGKTEKPMRVRLSCINCAIPENPFYEVDKFKTFDCKTSERNAHAHFGAHHVTREHFKLTHEELLAYFNMQKLAFQRDALLRVFTIRENRTKADVFDMWRQEAADAVATRLLGDADLIRIEEVPSLIKKLPGTMRQQTRAKLCTHFEELIETQKQGDVHDIAHKERRHRDNDNSDDDSNINLSNNSDNESTESFTRWRDNMARTSLPTAPHPEVVEPAAKRVCLTQPQDNLSVYDARHERICSTIAQYRELNGGVIDAEAKAAFSKMLLSNTQALIETPLVIGAVKPQPKEGFLYCFQSSRPNLVKIGFTTNPVKRRLAAINQAHKNLGVVFTLRYSVRTLDCIRDEKIVHDHFALVRVSGSGELFRTTPESVRDFFDRVIKPRYMNESGTTDYDFEVATDMDMDVEADDIDDMDVDVDDVGVDDAMPLSTPTLVPTTSAPSVASMPTLMSITPTLAPVQPVFPAPIPPLTLTPTSSTTASSTISTPSSVSVPIVVPIPTATLLPANQLEMTLKTFVLEHLVHEAGSFVSSNEIREVFLRHTGTDAALFPAGGSGPYTLLASWLNSANPHNHVLIRDVYIQNKYNKHYKKAGMGYVNLGWKDGPIADTVRDVRSSAIAARSATRDE